MSESPTKSKRARTNKSSTAVGDEFERTIYRILRTELREDRLWFNSDYAKIFRKKKYYSRDRGDFIVFDVAIEVTLPGAQEPSIIVVVECKSLSRPVGVDDVEEFCSKLEQVAGLNIKGVIASRNSFQLGARRVSAARKLGLLRYFDGRSLKWELPRSPSATASRAKEDELFGIADALSNERFRSTSFDFYLQSPASLTNSLWFFFSEICEESSRRLRGRYKPSPSVPFVSAEKIESKAESIRGRCGNARAIDLNMLVEKESQRTGLRLVRRKAAEKSPSYLSHTIRSGRN